MRIIGQCPENMPLSCTGMFECSIAPKKFFGEDLMVISNKPSNDVSIMKGSAFPIKLKILARSVGYTSGLSGKSPLNLTITEAKRIKRELEWALKKLEGK
jgi:hypothetical protein